MGSRGIRIIGLSVAGVLSATLATATSATAEAGAPQGALASCYAQSCEGKWPDATGCAADAFTPRQNTSPEGIIVELRYSPTCRAAWGRIRSGIPGDRVRVHSSDGSNYAREITSGSDTFTQMVNDAGLLAWACVRAAITNTLTCTGSY
ncbi:DUF2690 domain-containing protein [Actinophytocola sp.]|uniref:DUF2690 domain-containing protein n=1 Tax=Actinophytocola sp. TaxID=1872138 RepID=UPI0039C871A1